LPRCSGDDAASAGDIISISATADGRIAHRSSIFHPLPKARWRITLAL
jgi:hypothetical protein